MSIDALRRVIVGSGHILEMVAPIIERAAPMIENASSVAEVAQRVASNVQVGSRVAVASDGILRHTFTRIANSAEDGNDNNWRLGQVDEPNRGTWYEREYVPGQSTTPQPEVQGWQPAQEFMAGVTKADHMLFELCCGIGRANQKLYEDLTRLWFG